MSRWYGRFKIRCNTCGLSRMILRSTLVCPLCDTPNGTINQIPNRDQMKDVPK